MSEKGPFLVTSKKLEAYLLGTLSNQIESDPSPAESRSGRFYVGWGYLWGWAVLILGSAEILIDKTLRKYLSGCGLLSHLTEMRVLVQSSNGCFYFLGRNQHAIA